MRDWLEVFEIAAADATSLVEAMDAVGEHRLSFWDAMLWATARQAGCAAILSEDMQHGRRFSGGAVLNPFAPDAAAPGVGRENLSDCRALFKARDRFRQLCPSCRQAAQFYVK